MLPYWQWYELAACSVSGNGCFCDSPRSFPDLLPCSGFWVLSLSFSSHLLAVPPLFFSLVPSLSFFLHPLPQSSFVNLFLALSSFSYLIPLLYFLSYQESVFLLILFLPSFDWLSLSRSLLTLFRLSGVYLLFFCCLSLSRSLPLISRLSRVYLSSALSLSLSPMQRFVDKWWRSRDVHWLLIIGT